MPCVKTFRFHTGSIKRCRDGRLNLKPVQRFDSILVRLKALRHEPFLRVYQEFRFHTGSIKREAKRLITSRGLCFDSILVRLKDRLKPLDNPSQDGFDSILVRLKVLIVIIKRGLKLAVSIPYWFD